MESFWHKALVTHRGRLRPREGKQLAQVTQQAGGQAGIRPWISGHPVHSLIALEELLCAWCYARCWGHSSEQNQAPAQTLWPLCACGRLWVNRHKPASHNAMRSEVLRRAAQLVLCLCRGGFAAWEEMLTPSDFSHQINLSRASPCVGSYMRYTRVQQDLLLKAGLSTGGGQDSLLASPLDARRTFYAHCFPLLMAPKENWKLRF